MAFRDWAAERTNVPRAVCEAALAHVVKDKTEAAYFRSDLFDLRRRLMDSWARFATTKPAAVVPTWPDDPKRDAAVVRFASGTGPVSAS